MGWWSKIIQMRDALNYGEQLSNSATWKNAAIAVNAVSGFLSALLLFVPAFEDLDKAVVDDIARGVFGVVCLFNLYVHPATSKTVYLPGVGKHPTGHKPNIDV